MRIVFTKMQGLGNDFVVIDATQSPFALTTDQISHLADRHFGVGCDQVLLVEPPRLPGTEFHYRIFNADGSEVEQCGNGARCFARYVTQKGLTNSPVIQVGTAKGVISLYTEEGGRVRVNMGEPQFDPAQIPLLAEKAQDHYSLWVEEKQIDIGAVSMGNPHAVLLVEKVAQAPVDTLGRQIESHADFPQRINVGFMSVLSRDKIRLRVYERGVGETLACGTGACAAVVVGNRWGLLDPEVKVQLPGGQLDILWAGIGTPVWMSGPAEFVYEGEIDL